MATTLVNFRDLIVKALPISKRGDTWIDWNYTACSPIIRLNDLYYQKALDLDFYQRHSIQKKTMPELLNDLYDSHHRLIYITDDNNVTSNNHFTIYVPEYLEFGNWEGIISKTIDRYLYLGVKYTITSYDPGFDTEAQLYLEHLVAGLVGDETLGDSEIWAVQYVYNQFKGAGILSDFVKLHLMSMTSETNSLVDFMNPTTSDLVLVPNGGDNDWTTKGFASDGLAYIDTVFKPSASFSDVFNNCTILHISEDGGETSGVDVGVRNGNHRDILAVTFNAVEPRLMSQKGKTGNEQQLTNASAVGGYLHYADTSNHNIIKDGVVIGVDTAMDGTSVLPTLNKFLNAWNDVGSVSSQSKNRVCTYGEVDDELSYSLRIFVNEVLTEYNNRLNR